MRLNIFVVISYFTFLLSALAVPLLGRPPFSFHLPRYLARSCVFLHENVFLVHFIPAVKTALGTKTYISLITVKIIKKHTSFIFRHNNIGP